MSTFEVRRVGNSLVVALPAEALRILRAEGLHLTAARDGVLLTPYDPQFAATMTTARDFMARYRRALRELAR